MTLKAALEAGEKHKTELEKLRAEIPEIVNREFAKIFATSPSIKQISQRIMKEGRIPDIELS